MIDEVRRLGVSYRRACAIAGSRHGPLIPCVLRIHILSLSSSCLKPLLHFPLTKDPLSESFILSAFLSLRPSDCRTLCILVCVCMYASVYACLTVVLLPVSISVSLNLSVCTNL